MNNGLNRNGGLVRVWKLLGPTSALAEIKPPDLKSYDDWERFLEECRVAGAAAVYKDRETGEATPEFAGPLGFALLRRWRWLQDARERGIPFYQASAAFDAAIDRDREAVLEAIRQQAARRQKAMAERDGKRQSTRATNNEDISNAEFFELRDEALAL